MTQPSKRKPLFGRLSLILATSLTIPSFAQTSAPPSPVTPAFEVTTVKLSKSGTSGSHSNFFENGRFTASNILLKNLMQYQAYGIPEPRILGGPRWLNSERFDIEAKTDSATATRLRSLGRDQRKLQTQQLFQQLLADRFKLAAHWETRELPIYALVVAKNGPNLHAWKESDGGTSTSANNDLFTAQGVTMAELAQALTQESSRELGRIVVDRTGIDGKYNVTLKWTPDVPRSPNGEAESAAPPPDSKPSIFTVIQEQLGLKLKSAKGPVQVLVIDHAEMPSEN